MIQKKTIFNNLFTNHTITPQRLHLFGECVCTALSSANNGGIYAAIVCELQTVLEALRIEIGEVDKNLTTQVTNTKQVDELMTNFIDFMKDVEPVIARALGGRKSLGYQLFYPNTVMEYDKVNKSNIFLFTGRVHKTAETYATALGEKLTAELQAFKKDCNEARNKQRRQMVNVISNRQARNKYFTEAQWALTAAVHYAAFINRSNEAVSRSLFPFDMLYPKSRRKIKRFKGALDVLQTAELPNYDLITTATITIKNVCGNAHMLVWATDNKEDVSVPATAIVVKAFSTKKLGADVLKDWAGKKIMVSNSSGVNKAYYEIAITGLKKQQAIAMDVEREEEAEETTPIMIAAS